MGFAYPQRGLAAEENFGCWWRGRHSQPSHFPRIPQSPNTPPEHSNAYEPLETSIRQQHMLNVGHSLNYIGTISNLVRCTLYSVKMLRMPKIAKKNRGTWHYRAVRSISNLSWFRGLSACKYFERSWNPDLPVCQIDAACSHHPEAVVAQRVQYQSCKNRNPAQVLPQSQCECLMGLRGELET